MIDVGHVVDRVAVDVVISVVDAVLAAVVVQQSGD